MHEKEIEKLQAEKEKVERQLAQLPDDHRVHILDPLGVAFPSNGKSSLPVHMRRDAGSVAVAHDGISLQMARDLPLVCLLRPL